MSSREVTGIPVSHVLLCRPRHSSYFDLANIADPGYEGGRIT